jgi:phage/conjugal plasmid C-4 type zinc finger TraR family protein
MDFLDRASEQEIKNNQMALDNHFKAKQIKLIKSAENCIECGDEIPEARREASKGCQYCINCQVLAEQGKL